MCSNSFPFYFQPLVINMRGEKSLESVMLSSLGSDNIFIGAFLFYTEVLSVLWSQNAR